MSESREEPVPAEVEWIGRRVIGCAIAVHRALGPGYEESIYVEALCIEFHSRELTFERQVTSYLRTLRLRLGLIFNFNVNALMPDGFKRVVL